MKRQTITDFHLLDVLGTITRHVGSSHHNRRFQITLYCASGKIISIDYIIGWLWCCSKFQAKHRLQKVYCLHGSGRIVTVRFIHANYQVIKTGQYLSKGHPKGFLKFMEIKLWVRFTIKYLSNIEDEQLNLRAFFKLKTHLLISNWIWIIILAVINLGSPHFCL